MYICTLYNKSQLIPRHLIVLAGIATQLAGIPAVVTGGINKLVNSRI